jgi:hypothetical protein
MKIIAIEKEVTGETAEIFTTEILTAEAQKVWELYQSGFIREIYFRADQTKAVLILECSDINEARNTLQMLPLVDKKLIDFELIPLTPYSGLARLFKPVPVI